MKTIPPVCPEPEGQKYWRSIDQLAETPEFQQMVEREFPQGASELNDPVTRRNFVKLMSASALLAGVGLTGCRRPEEKILPFSKQPQGYIHGVPEYFASARPTRGSAVPVLVKSSDGRPTKVEGNADHPAYQGNVNPEEEGSNVKHGGTDTVTQASVLNLYDPDRAMRFAKDGNDVQRDVAFDFLAEFSKKSLETEGDGVYFLMEHSSSPSRQRLQKLITEKYKQTRWFSYEPVDFSIADEAVSSLFYREKYKIEYHLEKAERILSLDCDFIGAEQESFRLIRGFSKGRRIKDAKDEMNRLYVVEGLFTLTGANADHRLRVPTSQIVAIAARVATEVQHSVGGKAVANFSEVHGAYKFSEKEEKWITECVKDLVAHGKKCVVCAGYRQPKAVHVMAHLINQMLGNFGSTVMMYAVQKPEEGTLQKLVQRLNDGKVETLVIVGGNPVYNAPADLDFANACKKAKNVIRLGYYEDETAPSSTWHFPLAHYLESWGDVRTGDGTLTAIQPLIEPLFNGVRELEFLARIGGLTPTSAYEIVRETFHQEIFAGKPKASSDEMWKQFLHDGYINGTAGVSAMPEFEKEKISEALSKIDLDPAPSIDALEVVFHRDYKVDDGRYNNNGWLQELPDPITKLTWENAILMSYKTAKELGIKVENKENNRLKVPIVKVQVGGREIEGPVWIQPGMADYTLGLALGYGRTRSGRVGKGTGYNAYLLRTTHGVYVAAGAKLSKTGAMHPLATTQDHWAMEGRPIIREANLEQFRKKPDFAKSMQMEEPSLMPHSNPDGRLYPNPLDKAAEVAVHAWGMSIDLSSCVGCSACMVACQSENNIPIVGKDQVRNNREMHWIRIDRYFTSGLPWKKDSLPWEKDKDREALLESHMADPQMITQPMLCQHCEKAPCESVCPVNATAHDQEGLNVMIYNRCVGTRYCSNNCPYKVRRFNYFDYNKRPLDMLKDPIYQTPLTHSTEGEWDIARWAKSPESSYRPDQEWELLKLAKNPDVTVRMRGVMEKCTFCLQRIEQAKIAQKVKARASADIMVKDGAFTTACAQACPAEAIVFGNLKDPTSRVVKLKEQQRDYAVLEFLATKPRLTYLAKIRNPNPAIEDQFSEDPGSLKEYLDQHNENPFEAHEGAAKTESHSASEHAEKGAH